MHMAVYPMPYKAAETNDKISTSCMGKSKTNKASLPILY